MTNKKAKGDPPANVEGEGTATFRVQQTQQRALIWEFAIPLERLSAWSPGVNTTAGSAIKVGFEWGGASEEWKEAQLVGAAGRDTQARAGRATALPHRNGVPVAVFQVPWPAIGRKSILFGWTFSSQTNSKKPIKT